MKKLLLFFALVSLFFTSCEDDSNLGTGKLNIDGVYIVNYGNYGGTKGSLSSLNLNDSTISNYVYQDINNVAMSGNPQYIYNYKDSLYVMGNNKDEVYHFDNTFLEQNANGITDDIIKPRFCVGYGDYLYISCWGGDIWNDINLSYIAKYNITTNRVEKKIPLSGGAEGLEVVNGKLYCALNYLNNIAVMDLETEEFTFIDLPGVSSYMIKDDSDNLFISIIDSYSTNVTQTGIGYINTQTDQLEKVYELSGISTGYSSIMAANNDFSKIYIVASSWVEETPDNWVQKGGIQTLDVNNGEFETEPFLSNVDGMNGVSVNPETNDVYCLISESPTSGGVLEVYTPSKEKIGTYTTGISPAWVLFVN